MKRQKQYTPTYFVCQCICFIYIYMNVYIEKKHELVCVLARGQFGFETAKSYL